MVKVSRRRKVAARKKVHNKLRAGKLEKKPCRVCESTEQLEAHHPDYRKPLKVIWLCYHCHKELHNEIRQRVMGPITTAIDNPRQL